MNSLKKIMYTCILFLSLIPQVITEELSSEKNFIKKENYKIDEILDNGVYTVSLTKLNLDIIVEGHTGSGLIINILSSNKSYSRLEKSQNRILIIQDKENEILKINPNHESDQLYNFDKIEIKIPKNINIHLNKCNGDVFINDLIGGIKIESHVGKIEGKKLTGDVKILSSGGKIDIYNSKVFLQAHLEGNDIFLNNINGKANISTSGGNIIIDTFHGDIISQTIGGLVKIKDIEAKTINCKTSYGNIEATKINARVILSSQNGSIILNETKGNVEISSQNGDLQIINCADELICNTYNGDIFIKQMTGSVDAKSIRGNIKLHLNYSSSIKKYHYSLETNDGNIDINMPKQLSISLSSLIEGNRTTQDITSDIPLQFKFKENKIEGYAVINGGTIPMLLNSKNGFISIKSY